MAHPHDALTRRFEAIDDPQARTANLTALISSLSPWERRHIRLQLGDRDGLARFEDLSTDLICLLVPLLHLEDVLACSAVSRRCRSAWTEQSVASALSLHFFPGLQPPFAFSTFRRACRRYLRRRAGKYTSRFHMALPESLTRASSFLPDDRRLVPAPGPTLPEWTREFGRVLRPDPALHPDGTYPDPWPAMGHLDLVCYGGGNAVWYAWPRHLVVDNLRARTRRVIQFEAPRGGDEEGFMLYPDRAAANESLIILHESRVPDKLLIYNLETNVTSWFHLPSRLNSIVLSGCRIFLVISRRQICGLEHDGSRVLSKFHFWADKGVETACPDIDANWADALVYPHPSLPDRFFVALLAKPRRKSQTEGVPSNLDDESDPEHLVSILVVREFDGAEHVATYRHDNQRHRDTAPEAPNPTPRGREPSPDLWKSLSFDDETLVLDAHGLCEAGLSWVHGNRGWGEISLRRVICRRYPFVTFNTITRTFGFQQYATPDVGDDARAPRPWNQQVLIPWVPRPGVIRIRRFDADDADFVPSRVLRAETGAERESPEGWTIELEGVEEHLAASCSFYHDEDFTVLFIRHLQRYYVWSFVEEEEGEGKSGERPAGSDSECGVLGGDG